MKPPISSGTLILNNNKNEIYICIIYMIKIMKRKNSGYVMTSVLLDPKVREDFEKLLPKDKTLADAFRDYMKEVVDEEKKEEAHARLPILNSRVVRQTTITEYDIKLFQPSQERARNLAELSKDQQTKVAADVLQLQNQIRSVRKK